MTSETEVNRRYTDQESLSRYLQRKLERHLAGMALINTLEVLHVFSEIENLMIDEIALSWLRFLQRKQRDFMILDEDHKRQICFNLACGFEGGAHQVTLIKYMNETSRIYDPVSIAEDGSIQWQGYSAKLIIDDLVMRIKAQTGLRKGLPDLAMYAFELLEI